MARLSPFLVLAISAIPYLDRIAVGEYTTGVIQTLVGPEQIDRVRAPISPLLVLVPAEASEDLQFLSVGGNAAGVVEAFVTKDLQGPTSEGPQLVSGATVTVHDLNRCGVIVGSSAKALGGVGGGLDKYLCGGRSGQDGYCSDGEECESRELHGK